MFEHEYVLSGVTPEEYDVIIKQKENIRHSVLHELRNNMSYNKFEGIAFRLKYLQKRSLVGIFLEREGQAQLVLKNQGLNEEEQMFVDSLYTNLERMLDETRLPKEEWVENFGDDIPF